MSKVWLHTDSMAQVVHLLPDTEVVFLKEVDLVDREREGDPARYQQADTNMAGTVVL